MFEIATLLVISPPTPPIVGRFQTNPELAMSAEATMIRVVRYSTVVTSLMLKRLQVTLEEGIQGIEVRGLWRPSNRSVVSNSPPVICSVEVVKQRSRKIGLLHHRMAGGRELFVLVLKMLFGRNLDHPKLLVPKKVISASNCQTSNLVSGCLDHKFGHISRCLNTIK
ncbi:hypothetical protein TNCV_3747501 [Trichonephila clavipes]|nr:hypothetical protein TNCV_3747501 [Trichonephila clavipes]